MIQSARVPFWPFRHAPLVCLAALALACGAAPEPSKEEAAGEAAPPAVAPAEEQVGAGPVNVVLGDHFIEMPDTVVVGTRGSTAFRVRNTGNEEHNFEVFRGEEEVFRFRAGLGPGADRTIEIELEPGVYWVACNVAGHNDRGMGRWLTVLPAEAEGSGSS